MATTPLDVSILVLLGSSPSMLSVVTRFVTLFWPKKVKAGKLEEIHAKMVMKEGAPRASSSDGTSAAKKPRLSAGASSRAGGPTVPSTSTSSSHTNGKYR